MQLFYGPNSYQSNNACVTIPEYDALYKKSTRMPPGPERDKLYQEMTRILEAYAPHRLDGEPLPQPADPAARRGLPQAPDPAVDVAVPRRGNEQRTDAGDVGRALRRSP